MSRKSKIEKLRKRFQQHNDLVKFEKLLPHIRELQKLASQHGIHDVFQDNGGKLLQVLLVTGLTAIPGREGNDAKDAAGREYELKSVNRFSSAGKEKRNPQFTTHHLNQNILDKYREVDWVFALYSGIELEAVYLMTTEQLEPCFAKWEKEFATKGAALNNPKINLRFVQDNGVELYRNEDALKPGGRNVTEMLGDVESSPTGDV